MVWLNLATGQIYRKFNWEFAKLCAYIISKWNIKWRLVFQCVSTSCCCMQLYVDEASRSRKLLHNGLTVDMPIPQRFSLLGDSGNRGLHFFIPRGSLDLEPIPRGPLEFLGYWIPLNEPSLVINMTHQS